MNLMHISEMEIKASENTACKFPQGRQLYNLWQDTVHLYYVDGCLKIYFTQHMLLTKQHMAKKSFSENGANKHCHPLIFLTNEIVILDINYHGTN